MAKSMIRKGDWIVVCDGQKAIIFENVGDEKFLNLRTQATFDHPGAPTREQGAAPPGRAFQSVGPRRSAVGQTDWHDEAERAFLRRLAQHLDGAIENGQTKALTVIAAPRALGMIRAEYSPAVRHAIVREIDKDLVRRPAHEIEQFVGSKPSTS